MKSKNYLNKILAIFLIALLLIPFCVFADDGEGKITVIMKAVENGELIQDAELEMYKIADYSGQEITIVPELVGYVTYDNLVDDTLESAGLVEAALIDTGLTPVMTATSDISGKATFYNVPDGIYYVRLVQNDETDLKYNRKISMSPLILPMPELNDDGTLSHVYVCRPKCEISTTINVSVVKYWKDGGKEDKRPETISVSLYRDGSLIDTVSFSAEDEWKYEWLQLPAGSDYTVVENDVPKIYKSTVEENPENVFAITNVYKESEVPSTGDNMNIVFWAIIFAISAILLITFCIFFFDRKKKKNNPDQEQA